MVYRPLLARDIAQGVIYMLQQPLNISIKALDIVPSGKTPSVSPL
jgi:NADP-dependent 3-hydroxy acid dehydrogenase YdfG